MKYIKLFEEYNNLSVNDILLYHGTNRNRFEQFDLKYFGSSDGGWLGYGIYFTNEYEYAESYCEKEGYLYSVKLNLKNPLILNDIKYNRPLMLKNEYNVHTAKDLTTKLVSLGYDGVVLCYDEYDNGHLFYEVCVFNPTCIKIIDVEEIIK